MAGDASEGQSQYENMAELHLSSEGSATRHDVIAERLQTGNDIGIDGGIR